MRVAILGAGNVGRSLARKLSASGVPVRARSARAFARRPTVLDEDIVLLCVRDPEVEPLARWLAARRLVSRKSTVLHTAGGFGPRALQPLRGLVAGIGQAHPLVSFPDGTPAPLDGTLLLVDGDATANRRARWLARRLDMQARRLPRLDREAYHAAAALVANGSATLCGLGIELLVGAGMSRTEAARALGPLLRSVAEHVARLGLPAALTGPVRRGDFAAVSRHRRVIARRLPKARAVQAELQRLQVPLARALGEAAPGDLRRLARLLSPR